MSLSVNPRVILQTKEYRPDQGSAPSVGPKLRWSALGVLAIIAGFTLLGAGNQELNAQEARLGLAAGGPLGPLGIVYGAWFYGEVVATTAAVRWPIAIAAALLGLIAARRSRRVLGARGALLGALTFCGSIALLDRSASTLAALDTLISWIGFRLTESPGWITGLTAPRLNLIAGLGTILALGRALDRGFDGLAGLACGLAFMAGGWPAAAVALLPLVVLDPPAGSKRWGGGLILAAVVLGWSSWTISVAGFDAWAAAIALPLTQGPAPSLILWVAAYALPWSPFALLAAFRSVRDQWSDAARIELTGWTKILAASILAGTLIPGLGDAARVPALFAIALIAAGTVDALLQSWPEHSPWLRRSARIAIGFMIIPALIFGTWGLGYIAASDGYYRRVALLLIALLFGATGLCLTGLTRRRIVYGIAAVALLSGGLKLFHWGIYAPEWNYRVSQGPYGRAIGQWMPRASTLYFINPSAFDPSQPARDRWPADLAFATERHVQQIRSPFALEHEPGPGPHFVLLDPPEFEHWPEQAPPLVVVQELQDRRGRPRILARTEGPLYPDRRPELGE